MDYAGFKLFMSSYLGNDISDELCQTLFFTFHKKVPLSEVASPELPRALLKKFLAHNSALSLDSLQANGKCNNASVLILIVYYSIDASFAFNCREFHCLS